MCNLHVKGLSRLSYILIFLSFFQWTTDQDITDAVLGVGVNDFVEVKFFENRANGQSKGFCVITLGSEPSMRMCMERLPKKELHGQCPVVTFPTKQALNQVVLKLVYFVCIRESKLFLHYFVITFCFPVFSLKHSQKPDQCHLQIQVLEIHIHIHMPIHQG